ncbi:MAG: glycine--tRNA ligase [Cytophagales bacterium]|nr:MAG: glycine--tRNA ligase [Cytophagales bacterium]
MSLTPSEDRNVFLKIISHAKEYGFVFPSSEIYDGLAAVYDYGEYGVELKNNIKQLWWKTMVHLNENIVGLDAAIFMHPLTWKASGHIDGFSDPMIDNKDSKKRYRVDHLLEAKADELIEAGKNTDAEILLQTMNQLLAKEDFVTLKTLLETEKIVCQVSKTANWTEIRQFNLMFSTEVGAVAEEANKIYLRPETAQGIFVNFLNVQKSGRMKIPFGIAQIGKAFRNEIVARQFIFRMREFEQMEMQFFVRPGTEMEWYNKWKETRIKWHKALGFPSNKLKFHDHEKLAHYANAAVDIEYEFPFGFKEIEGIHSRTDFDLKNHQALSGKKQQYFDPEINQNYIPYVVETSVGADRTFLAVMCNSYQEETTQQVIKAEDGTEKSETKTRIFLKLHPCLAPIKVAIFPLVKKDGLPEKAKEIMELLKYDFNVIYEERDSVGKRYTRQDLIGTPFCVTVDYETLTDQAVTIRDRDTTEQKRVPISSLYSLISDAVSFKRIFEQL